ncbi:MAG: hypothetical protein AAGI54_00560 [Planctomycetota bacterium]
MITFLDGPAADITLVLQRAPVFLRAVVTKRGEWDALDLPDDEPKAGEQIHIYVRQGTPIVGFIDYRTGPKGGRRAGHPFASAEYRYAAEQPPDGVARDTKRWQAWCLQASRETLPRGFSAQPSCTPPPAGLFQA